MFESGQRLKDFAKNWESLLKIVQDLRVKQRKFNELWKKREEAEKEEKAKREVEKQQRRIEKEKQKQFEKEAAQRHLDRTLELLLESIGNHLPIFQRRPFLLRSCFTLEL
jgi:hypothetical protein